MHFQYFLRSARESKNLTIQQLAEKSGVSTAQISRMETGSRGIPKPDTLKKLAVGLEMDFDYLMKVCGYADEDTSSKIDQLYAKLINHGQLVDSLLSLSDEKLSALSVVLKKE